MAFDFNELFTRQKIEAPVRSYLWRVDLPDLSNNFFQNDISFDPAAQDRVLDLYQRAPDVHRIVSSRITNIAIPFMSMETEKAVTGNSYWYYAKHNDIGGIAFDVMEFEDGLTTLYFEAWKSLIINPNGTYNVPYIYKHSIPFYRLNGMKQEIIVHDYQGYFVSGIADSSNDYEANDIVKYSISLTGDSVNTYTTSLAGLRENPTTWEQLEEILSIESTLPTIENILDGVVKAKTGLNLPNLDTLPF